MSSAEYKYEDGEYKEEDDILREPVDFFFFFTGVSLSFNISALNKTEIGHFCTIKNKEGIIIRVQLIKICSIKKLDDKCFFMNIMTNIIKMIAIPRLGDCLGNLISFPSLLKMFPSWSEDVLVKINVIRSIKMIVDIQITQLTWLSITSPTEYNRVDSLIPKSIPIIKIKFHLRSLVSHFSFFGLLEGEYEGNESLAALGKSCILTAYIFKVKFILSCMLYRLIISQFFVLQNRKKEVILKIIKKELNISRYVK